jgi:gas vesicle protein
MIVKMQFFISHSDPFEAGIIFRRVLGSLLNHIKLIVMTTTTKVILGIVGAAAAGAVIGMLLAPDKGSELRKKVKDTANDWACQLADLFAEGKSELQNLKSKGSRAAKDVRNEAENTYNNARESFS